MPRNPIQIAAFSNKAAGWEPTPERQRMFGYGNYETVVDVLASGEVSISLTIEDRTRLDSIMKDLAQLGDVWVEEGRAIVAIVGPPVGGAVSAAVGPRPPRRRPRHPCQPIPS